MQILALRGENCKKDRNGFSKGETMPQFRAGFNLNCTTKDEVAGVFLFALAYATITIYSDQRLEHGLRQPEHIRQNPA